MRKERSTTANSGKAAEAKTDGAQRRYWANQGTRDIKCPFFKMHNLKEIVCEGLTDKCLCVLLHRSRKEKLYHQHAYCETKYEQCEYYRMLVHKYPEE